MEERGRSREEKRKGKEGEVKEGEGKEGEGREDEKRRICQGVEDEKD